MSSIRPAQGQAYNLGSESGFSVREVIQAAERVTGVRIPFEEKPRRAGDPAVLIASSEKIRKELGWKRKYPDLDTIVRHAWNWHQRHNGK
jgi:UDP-glucose 4-epimerase